MKFRIRYDKLALQDLAALERHLQSTVFMAIETILSHQATETSKSRIKRLRRLDRPQYRLRVDEMRVFYSVADDLVTVLGITSKEKSQQWLADYGEPNPPEKS